MALRTIQAGERPTFSRQVIAAGIAVILAGIAVWARGETTVAGAQDRPTMLQARMPQPDSRSVPAEAHRAYRDFWGSLPREKADAFERKLDALEARQRRGEAVERELEGLRREYPEFFQISGSLQTARWTIAATGGTQAATYTCTGLSWIGRNGRLRCLGKLVASGN